MDAKTAPHGVTIASEFTAYDFAESQGLAWGLFITIVKSHWSQKASGKLPDLHAKTVRTLWKYSKKKKSEKKRKPGNGASSNFQFLWVRENQPRKGEHLHLLTTIQDKKASEVQTLLTNKLRLTPGGVKAKKTGNPHKLMRYFCKQIDPRIPNLDGSDWSPLRDHLGLRPVKDDWKLNCRRAGVSRALGPACQRRAGFKRHDSIESLRDFFSESRPNPKLKGARTGPTGLIPAMPQ